MCFGRSMSVELLVCNKGSDKAIVMKVSGCVKALILTVNMYGRVTDCCNISQIFQLSMRALAVLMQTTEHLMYNTTVYITIVLLVTTLLCQ